MARRSNAAGPVRTNDLNSRRPRPLGRLLRSAVGADESLLGQVPDERRTFSVLSGVLLLSAMLGAAALAGGLGEAGVGAVVSAALVVILLVAQFVTGRIVASAALVLDGTRRWRLATGILMNLVITVPMSLLASDLLLLRIFAADAGTGGLLTRLANLDTLLHGSATGGTFLWAIRAVVFGVLILPVFAILAAPLSTYARLREAHRHTVLLIEENRFQLEELRENFDRRREIDHLDNMERERRARQREEESRRSAEQSEWQARARDRTVAEEAELRAAVDRLAEQMLRSGDS